MFPIKKEFFLKYYSLMTGLLVAAVYLFTID